jgi:transcriptional regulator with XRE-family HTH domain
MSEETRSSKSSLRQRLARRVRLLRLVRGWSQEVLAEVSGLHRTYISGIERGRRNVGLDAIEKVAGALEIPLADLLGEEDTTGRYLPRIEERRAPYPAALP